LLPRANAAERGLCRKKRKTPMKRDPRAELLRRQLQQLILLRETGPKNPAWHQARSRLIWRLHDEIKQDDVSQPEGVEEGKSQGDKETI
jgi:hypothetical protein